MMILKILEEVIIEMREGVIIINKEINKVIVKVIKVIIKTIVNVIMKM